MSNESTERADLPADAPEPPGVVGGMSREERIQEFFRLLAVGFRVREAAASVGLDFSTLYRKRREDKAFAKRWDEALHVNVPMLEAEALRRAMRGSDKLLMFLLTNLAPERFRKASAIEITNPDGSLAGTDAERAARVEALMAAAKARRAAKDLEELL